jgi:hypothetical protein
MKYRIVKHSGAYYGRPQYAIQSKCLGLFWINIWHPTKRDGKFHDLADAENWVEYLQTDKRVHKEVVKVFE